MIKRFVALSILFCLVFLNVPKTFVHSCNFSKIDHLQHKSNDTNLSFDTDYGNCFICEFDLGFFNVPDLKLPAFAKFIAYTFISPSVDYNNPESFFAFSHRGPPVA